MHISDGVLPAELWISGTVVTSAGVAYVLAKKTDATEMPKLAVVTGAMFVASLIHIPVGETSIHLILSGLAGIVLGLAAIPAIFVSLILQALLFQHGGLTTLGINTLIMGLPALVAYGLFWTGMKSNIARKHALFGGIAGGMAICLGVCLLYLCLLTIGMDSEWLLLCIVVPHLVVVAIEAVIVGGFAEFVVKVKPEILQGQRSAELG
ncbi:MAG: cobalt transporter CbiM [Chloroflexota bacterium]|nr:cobalt transporter CbiM [Chloroflexota bacterium]